MQVSSAWTLSYGNQNLYWTFATAAGRSLPLCAEPWTRRRIWQNGRDGTVGAAGDGNAGRFYAGLCLLFIMSIIVTEHLHTGAHPAGSNIPHWYGTATRCTVLLLQPLFIISIRVSYLPQLPYYADAQRVPWVVDRRFGGHVALEPGTGVTLWRADAAVDPCRDGARGAAAAFLYVLR